MVWWQATGYKSRVSGIKIGNHGLCHLLWDTWNWSRVFWTLPCGQDLVHVPFHFEVRWLWTVTVISSNQNTSKPVNYAEVDQECRIDRYIVRTMHLSIYHTWYVLRRMMSENWLQNAYRLGRHLIKVSDMWRLVMCAIGDSSNFEHTTGIQYNKEYVEDNILVTKHRKSSLISTSLNS